MSETLTSQLTAEIINALNSDELSDWDHIQKKRALHKSRPTLISRRKQHAEHNKAELSAMVHAIEDTLSSMMVIKKSHDHDRFVTERQRRRDNAERALAAENARKDERHRLKEIVAKQHIDDVASAGKNIFEDEHISVRKKTFLGGTLRKIKNVFGRKKKS